MSSGFGIFGRFGWVRSSVLVVKPVIGRVRSLVFPHFGPRFSLFLAEHVSKFRFFGWVRKSSKFGFGGRTYVRVSSKLDLSSSKLFEVHYIWVRFNTNMSGA